MNRIAKFLSLPAALAVVALPSAAHAAKSTTEAVCGGLPATIVVGKHSPKTVTGTDGTSPTDEPRNHARRLRLGHQRRSVRPPGCGAARPAGGTWRPMVCDDIEFEFATSS